VALHRQLADLLRDRIQRGEIGPGERLPTEAELNADFGLSTPTIRKAIKTLKDEGLVQTRAGMGTFVLGQSDQPVAPYEQIAATIRERISSGQIPLGRRIPSIYELEAEFGVARDTLRKAINLLRDEGLVETAVGKGVYVVRRPVSE
jgi:DNA-binding GntR family transcriptional regulator